MPRYIDADALLGNLKRQYGEELGWWCTVNMSDVGMMIEDAPTANVAPIADTVKKMQSKLYEEFLKVARCQREGEPNMRSQEVFPILDQIAKEILEGTK